MATEQPDTGPASTEDRLTAFFAGSEPAEAAVKPEAEAAPEVAPAETADPEQAIDDAAQAEETQADADQFVDVADDEGVSYKVPAKLKDAFLRQSDYYKKTSEVATLRKTAEDKIAFSDAKEQIFGAVLQDVVALRETQSRLGQLQGLDWAALYNADPGQALNLRNQMDTLKATADQQQQAIAGKAQQFEAARKKHSDTQWGLAVEGVKAKLGSVTPAEDAAMLKTVKDLGFSQDELTSRFADPRFLHAIYLASKSTTLAGQKPGALAAISKAPPVVKPGATVTGQQSQNKYREARERLKKSGRPEDMARLLILGSKAR